MTPLSDVASFLDEVNMKISQKSTSTEDEVTKFRRLVDGNVNTDLPAKEMKTRDLVGNGLKFRLYEPVENYEGPVIVYFHGGGNIAGGITSHNPICSEFAYQLGIPAFLPEYRLGPEFMFPTQNEDCENFCRYVATADLGIKITGLILVGDSSGGTLVISTTQALRDNPAKVPVVLQVPLYPLPDPDGEYESMELFAKGYFTSKASHDGRRKYYKPIVSDHRFSPLLGQHHNMPATVLVTTELDMSRDSVREYAKKLEESGTIVRYLEFKGTIHGFAVLRRIMPSSVTYLQYVIEAVKNTLGEINVIG